MTKLAYYREELLSEHDYSAAHVVAGRRMHGGLSADGTYHEVRIGAEENAERILAEFSAAA